MFIHSWTLVSLGLFSLQFSYDQNRDLAVPKYFEVTENNTLVTCLYPSDLPFKEGTNTLPRTELRSLEEYSGRVALGLNISVISVPDGTDYSIYQVFNKGKPFLMVRHRKGNLELVVFDGKPKIQILSSIPSVCTLSPEQSIVSCGDNVSKVKFKFKKAHVKLGIYAQGQVDTNVRCIEFGSLLFKPGTIF